MKGQRRRDRKRQKMKQKESQHARLGHSAVTRAGEIVLNQMPSLKVTLPSAFSPLSHRLLILSSIPCPSLSPSSTVSSIPRSSPSHLILIPAAVQPAAQGCVRFTCNNFTATRLSRTCYQYPYNGDRSITIQIYICVVPSNRHVKVHLAWIMKRGELWSRY